MKKYLLLVTLMMSLNGMSQQYQPDWQSLDSRPVPQWFKDSKFGIFIHWGVYSVPGWSSKGDYAEWYQYGLQTNDTARQRYHEKKFGNKTYYQLADDFKAELFNPDEWAALFEKSGARYIVLTSKHHDGFTLWPSAEANRDWGFKWNAVDVGPKRDLIADLFKAVRKTAVHPGLYYSLYEWFNPLWKADPKKFVAEHTWPQMKELINNYQPDVFWTDGDWDASEDTWKSKEFLAWMYNESPVKDRVVTYDRWGSAVRFKHGAVFTPEYQPNASFDNHYWEESRGMGFSYGYNRGEDAWDYNSAQSLVLQLIDKVSRGGNFLLDIGPDEHGKIPPIMQERLLQIGDWLQINGEAIYNTVKWKTVSQWSEGDQHYQPKTGSGDLLLKLTIDPDPGYAVKEIFYTYNENSNALYAVFPKYPDNKKLILKDVQFPAGKAISFLSTKENLIWQQVGKNVVISLPDYNPNKIKSPYAFVVKIDNFGAFAKAPTIQSSYGTDQLKPLITIKSDGVEAVRYTTDGTEPDLQSELYTKPFTIDKTSTIKAKSFLSGILPGTTVSENVMVYEWLSAFKAKVKPGIFYQYYEAKDDVSINIKLLSRSAADEEGTTDMISLSKKKRKDKFAFNFTGYIKIDQKAIYDFYLSSDDGSKLFIDGKEIINNDGDHGALEKSGKAALLKGFHAINIQYFDSGGDNELRLMMQLPGGKKMEVPKKVLFH
ncbi:MAG: alpha-L-fucosidase [Ferruginibacter sp.]